MPSPAPKSRLAPQAAPATLDAALAQVQLELSSWGFPSKPSWLSLADIRVKGANIILRTPVDEAGSDEARSRFLEARAQGGVTIGILCRTLGAVFAFVHAPRAIVRRQAPPRLAIRLWDTTMRPHAWGHRRVWWRLPGATRVPGLLAALLGPGGNAR